MSTPAPAAPEPRSAPPARPPRNLRRSLAVAAVASALYGGWAFSANWSAGLGVALRAAFAQAAMSIVGTFFLLNVLEYLFRLGRTPAQGFYLGAFGTTLIATGLAAGAHAVNGTPNIAATIAPLVAVAAVLYTVYAWRLRAAAERARAA
jgi:uncharacterized membrane protein HdeD (DUF308 family)